MELAEEVKGEFIDSTTAPVKVRIPMAPWTVTMEMHESTGKKHTRILLPFRYKSDFAFNIHNRNWIEDAQKTFGLQDIIVGFADFDRDFIIQGSEEGIVKSLFANEALREQITLQEEVRLALHRDKNALTKFGKVPPGIHVLAFEEDHAINSFDRLISIIEMLHTTMAQLCELSVATQQDPDFVF
jgi:hypothetical protein